MKKPYIEMDDLTLLKTLEWSKPINFSEFTNGLDRKHMIAVLKRVAKLYVENITAVQLDFLFFRHGVILNDLDVVNNTEKVFNLAYNELVFGNYGAIVPGKDIMLLNILRDMAIEILVYWGY